MSSKPVWKSLAEELVRRPEHDDPYMQRVAGRVDTGSDLRSVQAEIVEEVGNALGRAGAKLVRALEACERAARDVAEAGDDRERTERISTYERRREDAVHARWELVIHREAVGLRRHDDLDRHYPIPPRRPPG